MILMSSYQITWYVVGLTFPASSLDRVAVRMEPALYDFSLKTSKLHRELHLRGRVCTPNSNSIIQPTTVQRWARAAVESATDLVRRRRWTRWLSGTAAAAAHTAALCAERDTEKEPQRLTRRHLALSVASPPPPSDSTVQRCRTHSQSMNDAPYVKVVKIKVPRPRWNIGGGAHLPVLGRWARTWINYCVCDSSVVKYWNTV